MPIFEYEGKKYRVGDDKMNKFSEMYPDAVTIEERGGKKYRVTAGKYNKFLEKFGSVADGSNVANGADVMPQQQRRAGLREQVAEAQNGDALVMPKNWDVNTATDHTQGMLTTDKTAQALASMRDSGELDVLYNKEEEDRIDREFTPKPAYVPNEVYNNYGERFALTERGKMLGKELEDIQHKAQQELWNEWQNSDEYKQVLAEYRHQAKGKSQKEVDEIAKRMNDDLVNRFNMQYGDRYQEAVAPYQEVYNKELAQRYGDRINAEIAQMDKAAQGDIVKDMTADVDRQLVRAKQGRDSQFYGPYLSAARGRSAMTDEERTLYAAKRQLEASEEMINAAKNDSGVFRGIADNFDWENWTFGLMDLEDTQSLNKALKKSDAGESLTEAEQSLLDAALTNMIVQGYYASDLGRGYKAGLVTAESLPFMLEFIANPISSAGSASAKSMLKYGMKKYGLSLAKKNMRNRAIKTGAKMIEGASKLGLDKALGMTATSSLGRVAAGTYERLNENYDIKQGEDLGAYAEKNDRNMGVGEAIARSGASTFFENQSEMIFRAFGGASELIKNVVPQSLAGGAAELVSRLGRTKIGNLYKQMNNSPWGKRMKVVKNRAAVGDIGEEYLEEVYNNFANVAMGEMSAEDALSLENNIDTFLGLVPTQVMFSALGVGGFVRDKYRNKKAIGRYMTALSEKRAQEVQDAVLANRSDETKLTEYLSGIVLDNQIGEEERKNIFGLAKELVEKDALDGIEEARATEQQTPQETATERGYNVETPQEKHGLALQYEQMQTWYELLKDEDGQLAYLLNMEDRDAAVRAMNEQGYADRLNEAVNYWDVTDAFNGMIEGMEDRVAAEVADANKLASTRAHVNGTMIEATTVDRGTVFVKSGQIAINEDGTVNIAQSDDALLVVTEDGKREMIAPNRIMQAAERGTLQDVINANNTTLREQLLNQEAEAADMNPNTPQITPNMQVNVGGVPMVVAGVEGGNAILVNQQDTKAQPTVMAVGQLRQMLSDEFDVADSGNSNDSDYRGNNKKRQKTEEEIVREMVERLKPENRNAYIDARINNLTMRKKIIEKQKRKAENKADVNDVVAWEAQQEQVDKINAEEDARVKNALKAIDNEISLLKSLRDNNMSADAAQNENTSIEQIEQNVSEGVDNGSNMAETPATAQTETPVVTETETPAVTETPKTAEEIKAENKKKLATITQMEDADARKLLYDYYGEQMKHKATVNREAADKKLEAAEKAVEKAQQKYDDAPIEDEDKAEVALAKAKEALTEAQRVAEFWGRIDDGFKGKDSSNSTNSSYSSNSGDRGASLNEPQTAEERAADAIGNGEVKLLQDSFKKETGYGNEEARGFIGIFASKEKGGKTIKEAVEYLVAQDEQGLFGGDVQVARNAILNVLAQTKKKSELKNYIANNRQAAVEADMQAEREAYEAWAQTNYGMSAEEYEAYEESRYQIIREKAFTEEEYVEYISNFADENVNNNEYGLESNEQSGTDELREGSGTVLSEEQPVQTERTGDVEERPSETDGGINIEDGASQSEVEAGSEVEETEEVEGEAASEEPVAQRETSDVLGRIEDIAKEEERRKPLRARAREWEEKLGVKVRLMEDVADVTNASARRAILSGRKVTGWYDDATGEVCLYMPYLKNAKEVDLTYLHEVVAHKGLRQLLGEEGFNNLCDKVYEMMSPEERHKMLGYSGVANIADETARKRAAADEYMAHLAENTEMNPSVWDEIVEFVKRILWKLIGKKYNKVDVAEVIRESYINLMDNKGQEGGNYGGGVFFNIKDDASVVANREKQLKRSVRVGLLSQSEADEIREASQAMLEISQVIADAKNGDGTAMFPSFSAWNGMEVVMNANGRPVVSVIKANSEYPMNIDFAKDCIKRDATNVVLNRLAQVAPEVFTQMSAEQLSDINNIIKRHGLSVPCVGCFVESKRYRAADYAKNVVGMWNDAVDAVNSGNKAVAAFKKKHGDKVSVARVVNYLQENPSERIMLHESDIVSPENYANLLVEHPQIPMLLQHTQGQNNAQLVIPEAIYYGDVLKLDAENQWSAESAYQIGGVRIQSFSDFKAKLFFDYCQVLADLASKKLPAHSYTKVPAYAELFGLTGMKINLSLFYEGNGLDANGNYTYSDESISPEFAFDIQSRDGYTENVGTMAVGVSDEHIWKLLKDGQIRSVIPYHKSGINSVVSKKIDADKYTDYTNEQNAVTAKSERNEGETFADYYKRITARKDSKVPDYGKKVAVDFNLYDDLLDTEDPIQTAKNYVSYCQENGIVPKFPSFVYNEDGSFNDEYYKLLYDFSVFNKDGVYAPQHAVTWNSTSMPANTSEIVQSALSNEEAIIAANAEQADAVVDDILSEVFEKTRFRFVDGMTNDEIYDGLNGLSGYSNGAYNLMNALEEYYGGRIVSASSGARHAIENGLVPVPKGQYEGANEEYHHLEFEGENGETFVKAVPFVEAEGVEENEGVRFREVKDPKVIAELEASPKRRGFRNVVRNEDGTFSSPMAYWLQSTTGGAKTRVETAKFELGKWEEAEEHPELVDEEGHITLVKPNKGTVPVAYDPYIHNRLDPVNLQFKDAWKRDDLIYVETEVPTVDLESGYHAEKALLPVGVHSWSNGDLMLSKYDKPTRFVPWDEVADAWVERLDGKEVHFDVVPPALRSLLVERGVNIVAPHKGMGKDCKDAYTEWKESDGIRFRSVESETIVDVPQSKVLYTAENIGDKLYKVSGKYMKELYKENGELGHVLKKGTSEIDQEKAKREYERVKPIFDEYRKELIDMKGRSTEAAQEVINELIADVEYSVQFYKDLSEGKDSWRTGNMPRFREANENQEIFVSNAEKAVKGIKQEKGTPQQWLAMIEKNGGLKAGEDKWLGLSDWLKEKDGSNGSNKSNAITKQEILDFIGENKIRIEEVVYGDIEDNPKFKELEKEYQSYYAETYDSDVAFQRMVDKYGEEFDVAFNGSGMNLYPRNEYGSEDAQKYLGVNEINSTRRTYTTDGLDNKREIALTVPTIEPWNKSDEIHFGDAGEGRAVAWIRFGETNAYESIDDVQEVTEFHEPYKSANVRDVYRPVGSFKNGDYVVYGKGRDGNMIYVAYINDKQIPVAHETLEDARNAMNAYYKEHPRKLRKPLKVLVIDEIQSKRHQEGREHGYDTNEYKNYTIGEYRSGEEYDIADILSSNGSVIGHVMRSNGVYWAESVDGSQMTSDRNSQEEAANALLNTFKTGIPSAPFEKNWHELAMKRMLRLAAEEGFDKVAWTTGTQQAERYDLGAVVDHISYYENEDGTLDARAYFSQGGYQPIGKTWAEVESNVGKDIAKKMQEGISEGTESLTWGLGEDGMLTKKDYKTISGDNLSIGGEGMKGFYDKMLPSFVQKYVKKWGAKVGEVELPKLEESARKMWSVDVTPEMKESVMEGQVMFREITDPAIQREVDKFKSRYNSAEVEELPSEHDEVVELMMEDGFSRKEAEEMYDNQKKTKSIYDPIEDKIYIFAGKVSAKEVEEALLHENVHRSILAILSEEETKELADALYELHPKLGENIKNSPNYKEADFNEEMIAYSLQFGHRNGMENYLGELVGDKRIQNILNYINYDRRRENSTSSETIEENADINQTNRAGRTDSRGKNGRRNLGVDSRENRVSQSNDEGHPRREHLILDEVVALESELGRSVNAIDEFDALPEGKAKEAIKAGRKVLGWYQDGQVYVYLPNARSASDVRATVYHEVVGHLGLRELLGERFGEFLNGVYMNVPQEVRDEINRRASKNGWDFHEATEEYMAELAERYSRGEQVSGWKKILYAIRDAVVKALNRLGMNVGFKMSDNYLMYVLWRSRQRLQPSDVMGRIADRYMRNVFNVDGDVVVPATKKDSGYSYDSDYRGVRFREVKEDAETRLTREFYEKQLKSFGYRVREGFQDSMLALKTLQEAIAKATNHKVEEREDAYIEENHLSSRNTADFDLLTRNLYKPMMRIIHDMMKKGNLTYQDVLSYLNAKHGIERNRDWAVRDELNALRKIAKDDAQQLAQIDQMEQEYYAYRDTMYQELENGNIDFDEYCDKMDDKAREYAPSYNGREDYSGLSDLFGHEGDVADEWYVRARDMISNVESAMPVTVDKLWSAVRSTNQYSLDKAKDSGTMSVDAYDKISNQFKWYVPLRGFNEQTAEDVYDYFSEQSATGAYQSTVKKGLGRKSQAGDIVATMFNMAQSAIMHGNKNVMKQKFLNLVMNSKTGLVTVLDNWYVNVGTETDPVWEAAYPDFTNKTTPEEIAQTIKDFEDDMKVKAAQGLARKEKGHEKLPYRPTKAQQIDEHMVIVKRNGKEFRLILNANPRAAQALNGMTNPSVEAGAFEKFAQWINPVLASLYTTKNPTFIARNLIRDTLMSGSSIAIKESFWYNKRFVGNQARSLANIGKLIKKYEAGTLDVNVPIERYFKEFVENGAETGYSQLWSIDEFKKNIEKDLKRMEGGLQNGVLNTGEALLRGLEFANRCAEDMNRFAVYMTSRESGRSIQRSVHDAKEVSVNFNKKGAGAKTGGWVGALAQFGRTFYLFFNAAIQGLKNYAKLAKEHPMKFTGVVGMYAAWGAVMPLINELIASMSGDDDEDVYGDLPEWVRRNNMCLYLPFMNTVVTVPLPIELRAIYGLGEATMQIITGKENKEEAFISVANLFMEMLPINPLSSGIEKASLESFLMSLAPTLTQPMVQHAQNKSWTGSPLYRDTPFNKEYPAYTKAYKGTPKLLVESSKFLNDMTGGDEVKAGWANINPAIVDNYISGYLGGVGTTIMDIEKTVEMFMDEPFDLRNIPVVKAVVQTPTERNKYARSNSKYFELLNELKEYERLERGYNKIINKGGDEVEKYLERLKKLHSQDGARMMQFKDYNDYVDGLRKIVDMLPNGEEKDKREKELNMARKLGVEKFGE